MANTLNEVITAAYYLFSNYHANPPLNICQCNSCIPLDEQHNFLAIPLRELPPEWLQSYLSSVPLNDEYSYIQEVKHFLPRILELLAQKKELGVLTETTLSKLALNHNDCWNPDEQKLIRQFAHAFTSSLFTEEAWQTTYRSHIANYLLMFHWAGLRITDELTARWNAYAHTLPALSDFIDIYQHINWEYNRVSWKKLLHLPDYCPQRDEFIAHMDNWFNQKNTRRIFHTALEEALLHNREPSEETALWESVYDWLEYE
ncbi:hypothetical protein [Neisseria zalophi]|uniref:Uncharacterized protein n=1 Tax=Neisseria zalophi TaxID=640030 RepID=A0A5J6PXI0_9NEIS|nr:hypothetical protein [Neisseria zalophi]QEY26906.1 hypothetical protein D0T92_10435 [Neisseria zalophi]